MPIGQGMCPQSFVWDTHDSISNILTVEKNFHQGKPKIRWMWIGYKRVVHEPVSSVQKMGMGCKGRGREREGVYWKVWDCPSNITHCASTPVWTGCSAAHQRRSDNPYFAARKGRCQSGNVTTEVMLPLINKWQSHQCYIQWYKWAIRSMINIAAIQ